MKKFFIPLFLGLSFQALSQEFKEEVDNTTNSNRRYKNEAGIDISALKILLDNTPSLFYRRHFIKVKTIKGLSGINKTTFHAWRFRVGSNLSFEKVKTPDIHKKSYYNNGGFGSYLDNYSNSYSFVRLGREQQWRFTKFELFFGYDLVFNYSKLKQSYARGYVYNIGTPAEFFENDQWGYKSNNLSYGLAGIAGFKYFLIPRLCFSAEATLNFLYSTGSKKITIIISIHRQIKTLMNPLL